MNLSGQGGPVNISDGANNGIALGRQSELLATELHGRYKELASRSLLFHGISPAVTVAAANVSPIAAGGTPILGLWNPPGSGKNLALIKHHIANISGQPGGPLLWNFALNQNLSVAQSGFAQSIPGTLAATSSSAGRVLANTAATGSTLSQLLKIAQCISAGTAALGSSIVAPFEEEAGDIVLPPGALLSLAAYAAGSSHVLMASFAWEEFPI